MASAGGDADELARLAAQVVALEELLRRRSRELRLIQEHCCPRDLRLMARVADGLAPLPGGPFEPEIWTETSELTEADVAMTLQALWRSLAPPGADER
jgi:hypothetical protein